MRKLLCVMLIFFSSLSLISTEQTMTVSESNFLLLKEKLNSSLVALRNLNEKILSLEKVLLEAETSAETSSERILALTQSLDEALRQREGLEKTVNELKLRSAKLSASLSRSQKIIDENETRHLEEMEDVGRKYDSISKWLRRLNYLLAGVAAAAIVWGATR